jgi:DNA-binding HxlR family transcriptional regulator
MSSSDEFPGLLAAETLANRMQRGELFAADCPSREVLKHVTSRWGVLVLVALLSGTHRFSELRRKIGGVSEKMLAQTLQWLEGDGMVLRISYAVVPPHVEYSLTPLGVEAARQVEAMADWIEGNLWRIMAARRELEAPAAEPGVTRHYASDARAGMAAGVD